MSDPANHHAPAVAAATTALVLYVPAPLSDSALPSPSAADDASRSLLSLAVVERQLVMQLLDLASLSRLARSCHQLCVESLHPSAGRFLPGADCSGTDSPLILKPCDESSLDHPAHHSALVRQHVPFHVRLDSLSDLPADEAAHKLERLLTKLGSIKRVRSLSVWHSPAVWTEEQALSLLSAVSPTCASIWGVRCDSVWVRPRVQRAIFSMPLLEECCAQPSTGLAPTLEPSSLALASRLHSMVLMIAPSSLAQSLVLTALPSLTKLCLYFSTDPDEDRPLIPLLLPQLRTLELVLSDDREGEGQPTPAQVRTLLEGAPGLRTLEFQDVCANRCSVETCVEMGPGRLPALRAILLLGDNVHLAEDVECVQACLLAWPELQFVVTHGSPLESALQQSNRFCVTPRGDTLASCFSSADLSDLTRQVRVTLKDTGEANGAAAS